jgi:signal transduction histidine kinase
MKNRINIIFAVVLLTFCLNTKAQTKYIDSLRRQIELTKDLAEKNSLIAKLAGQPINSDTLLPYVLLAESITGNSKNEFNKSLAACSRAYYYIRKNYVDSALVIMERLVEKHKKDNEHKDFYLGVLFFKAKILDRGNRYTASIAGLYKVIQEAELQKDTFTLIQAKTGIGWVQMEMEQYKEALQWLYKALNTSANKKFYKNYGALYSNIASTYNALGKTDSAKVYIDIAIKDARENDNLAFLATALSIQAKIFTNSKEAKLAAAPLQEIVAIRKQLNDPFYTVYDMSSLASYYASNKQTAKGIALCKEGIALAQKSGLSSQLLMVYHALAQNYKAAGNTVEYGKTLEAIIALKDSFNNINSSKLLADMQAGSEAAKNEKTIAAQKLNLTVKNYWLVGSAIFAIMAGIIIWLAFKYYNRKQNIKMQLALAEEKRMAAQSIIEAEEQERKRIAADLHDNIGAYASAIRADVEKITTNGFEKNNASLQNLEQHSQEIINSLRDTIWVLNKDNITITGISDRIKNYVSKLRPSYNHILFQINEDIQNDVRISSQNALNIFRIVQEAVHNAIKHSAASIISISISSQKNMEIQISDDGKGMEENIVSAGNGLINMKARAKQAGMILSISSALKQGTQLVLQTATTN